MDLLGFGVGSLVLGVGAAEIFGSRGARSLERQRRLSLPYREVIPWRSLLSDGVVRLEGDRLQATWELTGSDLVAAARGRYASYLDRVHRTIIERGDNEFEFDRWQLNIDAWLEGTRGYIDGPESSDPTTSTLAWARRRRFEQHGRMFTTRGPFLTATYEAPPALIDAFTRFAIEGGDEDKAASVLERGLRGFNKQLGGLEEALNSAFVAVRRLRGIARVDSDGYEYVEDEQLRFLSRCATGVDQPVVRPPLHLVAQVIGSEDYETGFEPRVGRKFVKVIAIEDFPERSFPGDFDFLADLGIEHRHFTRVQFLSAAAAERRYDKARGEADMMSIPLSARIRGHKPGDPGIPINPAHVRTSEQANRKGGEVTDGEMRSMLWTSGVVLFDTNLERLRAKSERVAREISDSKYKGRIETVNAWEAFVGSLPGDAKHNVPDIVLDSINMLDTAQISTPAAGPMYHPSQQMPPRSPVLAMLLSHGKRPKRFVDSVGDNMHQLVFGDTGYGKSTAALATAAWGLAQYPQELAYIFDQGGSAERWGSAVGRYNRLRPDAPAGLAFFDGIEDMQVRLDRAEIIWHVLQSYGHVIDPGRFHRTIWKAMCVLARSARRSMTLYQAKLGVFDGELARALSFYTISGAMGYLVDCERDSFGEARAQVFELGDLMHLKDERAIALVLMLIFSKMRQRLGESNSKGRIIIDEPKDYFKLPALANAFEAELDKARKRRTGVTITSLRPSDLLKWSIGKTVATSCKTHWVFGIPAAQPPEGIRGGGGTEYPYFHGAVGPPEIVGLGYTDEECTKIASLPPHRALLRQTYGDREESTIVNQDLDPIEVLFVGANDKDQREETDALRRQFPQEWPAVLLERHGHPEAAAHWRARAAATGWRFEDEEEVVHEVA